MINGFNQIFSYSNIQFTKILKYILQLCYILFHITVADTFQNFRFISNHHYITTYCITKIEYNIKVLHKSNKLHSYILMELDDDKPNQTYLLLESTKGKYNVYYYSIFMFMISSDHKHY